MLARTCAFVGDAKSAEVLYDLMLPYADRTVVAIAGAECSGALGQQLGMLAAAMGRWDEADAHFARAHEIDRRTGTRTFYARGLYEHAAMLTTRDRPGDRERAQA